MADLVIEPAAVPRTARPALDAWWWAGALTLAERGRLPSGPTWPVSAERAARARRRWGRWREAYWLGGLDRLIGRLAPADQELDLADLDEAGLLALLAEEPADLAGRAVQPDWAYLVEAIVAGMPAEPVVPVAPGADEAAGRAGLAAVVAPFTEFAGGRVAAAVRAERLDALVDLDPLRRSLVAGLEPVLVGLAGRTLVLELHVRRVTGQLTGETPQQRFWSFVRQIASSDGLTALLGEYPVLARLLVQTADRMAAGWIRMLHRLATDRAQIVDSFFGGADPGRLAEVIPVGDAYHHRCSVALRFTDGARLVYRPQPLDAQRRFGEVVGWLNRRLPGLDLRTLTGLDRDGYGWVELVGHRPCAGRDEIHRLYHRFGALLALFHALDGADLQAGDVVACGDQPVPVDVAGLFRAGLSMLGATADVDPAQVALEGSVRRIDLLPPLACTSASDQPLGYPAVEWAAPGTDQMRLVRRPAAVDGRRGTQPDEAAQTALLSGFRATYDALVDGREELVGPGGLLWRFADAQVRIGTRSTTGYHKLLADSTHPDAMRDALDRDRVLGLMWAIGGGHPTLERLARSELATLRGGATGYLVRRAGSRDVAAGDGLLLRDVLSQTGLAHAAGTVRALAPAGRTRQEWIIQAWFAERTTPPAGLASPAADRPTGHAGPIGGPEIDPQRCLAVAGRLADRLADAAYQQGERAGWLGLATTDEQRWTVRPLGVGLYHGYPGVALFLAKLAELTGDERYAMLARRALAHVPAMLESFEKPSGAAEPPLSGPFLGVTGLAYALVQVAASLREPTLLDAALPPIAAAAMAVSTGEPDVLGGAAGCVAAMLAVGAALDSPAALRVAGACARGLVRANQVREDGLPWETGLAQATCTPVGFARGASGIGWALLQHAKATGVPRSTEVGLAAFRYERERWPAGGGWCRGVAGIGLARAASLHTGDAEIAGDLDRAVQAVVSAGPLADHSLCHGELGSLELLTVAIESGRTDLTALRQQRAALVLDAVERSGPRCGTPHGVITPGLLTGVSGIGYGLLRLAFPDRVPSVLLLEPPSPVSWAGSAPTEGLGARASLPGPKSGGKP